MKLHSLLLIFGLIIFPTAVKAEVIKAESKLAVTMEDLKGGSIKNQQLAQSVAQEKVVITGVQLKPTETGLEIILESPSNLPLQPLILSQDKDLIIEVLDATLQLPEGQEFNAANPTQDITQIKVTQLEGNIIRVTVTGTQAAPTGSVIPSVGNLILNLTPSTTATTPADEQIEVVVTEEGEQNYYVPNSSEATKLDIPIRDFPGSIQIIPQRVIRERNVVRLSELTDNVSGVQKQSGYGGASSFQTYIRGFPSYDLLRNGFKDFGFISPRDVANVEQVEFLKGPASILYGNVEPGGIVNTVTKQPLEDPFYQFDFTIGNNNFYRPTIDLSGPITPDRSLLYRFNLAYENAESFRDFYHNESIFAAPVITLNLGEKTKLTVEFNYQNYDYFFDRAFLPSNEFLDLPIHRVVLGEKDYNNGQYDSYYVSYNFEHEFDDNWKIRQGFGALIIDGNISTIQPANYSAPFLEPDGKTLPRSAQKTEESQDNYTLQTEVLGKFNTGSVRHNLLVGVELSRYEFAYTFRDAPIGSIDIFNPVYGSKPGEFVIISSEKYGSDNLGLYAQDLIELLPNLKILVGVRLDWAKVFYRDEIAKQDYTNFDEFAATPRAGIVYQPTDSTSLYFSWSRSFNPQVFSVSSSGEAFEPEEGEQFEIGVKQEFFEGRLSASVALYDITKTNVQTTDPANPNFSIAAGEQKSNGIELELVGEILPGWNIIATYAYTNAYVSEDNNLPVGDQLAGIPLNSASLWTTYQIQGGNLEGLGFGLGIYYMDSREGQLPNTSFKLPSSVRTDAAIFYEKDNYRVALNFKNIFDVKYYETQGFYVTPQAPFTVLGSVSFKF